MSVRVVHLAPALHRGGLERMVHELATRADRTRYEVGIQLFDGRGAFADAIEARGVRVAVDPRRPGFLDVALVRRFAARWRADGVRLVHAHNSTAMVYGALSGGLAGIPVVYTEHGQTGRAFPHELHDRALHALAARFVTRAAAVASWLRDALVRWDHFPRARVDVVPNGIDPAPFLAPADGAAIRRALGLRAAAPVVGCVARLVPIKNHRLLLEAWRRVSAEIPSATLVLVGDGPEAGALRRQAVEAGIAPSIHFLGERGDVPDVLRAIDVHVLASRNEGTSLTLLEAMAAGAACVATAVGGTCDVLDGGRTGVLVPPEDAGALASAITALLHDPARRAALGASARADVLRRYSVEAMLRRYDAIYADCVESTRAVSA